MSVGGGGGTGNTSGIVDLISSNSIKTSGDNAYGLLGQSIGGGGGNSGATINVIKDSGIAKLSPKADETNIFNVSVGQGGGTGAQSSTVKVTNTSTITTTGKDAIGLFAQSIGGSGGNAGGVYTGTSNVKKRSSTNFSIGAMVVQEQALVLSLQRIKAIPPQSKQQEMVHMEFML